MLMIWKMLTIVWLNRCYGGGCCLMTVDVDDNTNNSSFRPIRDARFSKDVYNLLVTLYAVIINS